MNTDETQLILGLADRLRHAEPVAKDPLAEELIRQHISTQPDVLYLLTQAVLVQEEALRTAEARIAALNEQIAAAAAPSPSLSPTLPRRGLMSGIFGRSVVPGIVPDASAPPAAAAPVATPGSGGGGNFLKTAAVAAAGVAGGGLLLQGLNGAFGGHGSSSEHHADGGDGSSHDSDWADTDDDFW